MGPGPPKDLLPSLHGLVLTPLMFGSLTPPLIQALCAADISDMVAAVTNGPAAGIATTSVA